MSDRRLTDGEIRRVCDDVAQAAREAARARIQRIQAHMYAKVVTITPEGISE